MRRVRLLPIVSLTVVLEGLDYVGIFLVKINIFKRKTYSGGCWKFEENGRGSLYLSHLVSFPALSLPQPSWPPCCSLNAPGVVLPWGLCAGARAALPAGIYTLTHSSSSRCLNGTFSASLSLTTRCKIAPARSSALFHANTFLQRLTFLHTT